MAIQLTPAPLGVVLVVDDDQDVLEAVSETLDEAGWRVVRATSAETALREARSNQIDVVLADVLMPDKDGHALASALHDEPRLASTPLVFMTASPARVRTPGAIVLEKPFTLPMLLSTLERSLARRGDRL
jgi:CheY-like chemotaxis protein